MTTPSRGPLGASPALLGKVEGAECMLLSGRRSREADLDRFPIVIMGGGFWEEMRDFVRRTMVDEATIDASDLDLAQPAESPEEALRLVERGRRRDGDAG